MGQIANVAISLGIGKLAEVAVVAACSGTSMLAHGAAAVITGALWGAAAGGPGSAIDGNNASGIENDLGVVRFHGRSDKWSSPNLYERYGYLYSVHELKEWAPEICELARQTAATHVIMKNVYRDYAQRSATQLADLLRKTRDCPVRPPAGRAAKNA